MSNSFTLRLPTSGAAIALEPGSFSSTTTGEIAAGYPCDVRLRYQPQAHALRIDFACENDPYVAQNNYTADNSELYKQEVFEVFISAGAEVPTRYLELELNPNGALFSAWVENPDGVGTSNTLDFFDGHAQGIKTSVFKEQAAYRGQILLPLQLLGASRDSYRINFFRVVSRSHHDPRTQWACTADSCDYLAWSPTFSGATPKFHITAHFGHLRLQPPISTTAP